MNADDYSVLLSLMETGIVSELKTGRMEEIKLNTRVYAACNDIRALPAELKSRFIIFKIKGYSEKDFKKVSFRILTEREGVSVKIAKYISERLAKLTRDVRDAVNVARILREQTKEDVDRVIKTFSKYQSFLS